jgi:arylsulfate sulfotransferase
MNRIPLGAVVFITFILFSTGCNSATNPPPDPVQLSVTRSNVVLFATQSTQLAATDSAGDSDVVWSVSGSSGATVTPTGIFTAPPVTQNTNVTVVATSRKDSTKTASTVVTVLAPGQVTATNNPQVALYTLTPPPGMNVFIQFATDTSYRLKTWTQPAPTSGSMSFYVAGMLASTEYHMRAVVEASDGSVMADLDHTFTTGAVTAAQLPSLTATTTPGMIPQPGIEMLDLLFNANVTPLAAVDLSGNPVWTYTGLAPGEAAEGVHLLPNGHFLLGVYPYKVREIDLAGNTIREESLTALNNSLSAVGFSGTLDNFNHDVIALPNGHWIALVQVTRPCSAIPNCSGLPDILGDALVDLAPQSDGTFTVPWTWSTFDHLDINRALNGYPDWTHSNAIVYSPDDGNLLLSIRHQSWIIKIDYANGSGAGDILWRLGYQGDFTLISGTDPTDWFYAQHGPAFATPNTTGKFRLAVMDNGNGRVFPLGVVCGSSGAPACSYSAAPLLEVDETAKTATIISSYQPGEFSSWGGEAQQLADGNMEGDFNAGSPTGASDIFEATPGSAPQVVWHLQTSNANAYRGFRMPSLYPGVQW